MSSSSSSMEYSSSSSSSDSSLSSLSSSSSSGYFCANPSCEGEGCLHFSNWNFDNIYEDDLGTDILYVRFNVFGSIQQVEIYRDPNYFELISIGQGTTGSINLEERNSSGLSGSVDWDLTPTTYNSTAILYCLDRSTSSSSSSLDSSSSSSLSSLSLSSSSENCCTNYNCHGTPSDYFSNWVLNGVTDEYSDGCELYVGFDYQDGYQEVRIYSDNLYSNLVAIGQGTTGFLTIPFIVGFEYQDGSISIDEIGGSGITGSVFWTGVPVSSPSFASLSCQELSTSSSSSSMGSSSSSSIDSSSSSSIDSSSSFSSISQSSSSSSIDSSSSSSSTSMEYSSSSSQSLSSSSSETSLSSSSSSSKDSSSSSSESVGNVSSSSSSSIIGETWNRTKKLAFTKNALSSGLQNNRLGQVITLDETTYSIGKVYLYLDGPYGKSKNYTLFLDIYNFSEENEPLDLVSSASINGENIIENDWNLFNFQIEDVNAPSSQKIGFVLRQEGGNENNYVSWSYSTSYEEDKFAVVSNDNVNWDILPNIEMNIRVLGIFNPYDFDNSKIISPPANKKTKAELIDDPITSTYANVLCSIVVDDSGSMTWNDRAGERKDLALAIFNKFQDYPGETLFDVVKFGSSILNSSSTPTIDFPNLSTIKVDLISPAKTTFIFDVTTNKFGVGDVYTANNISFNIVDKKENILVAEGKKIPSLSGNLTKDSGSGDNEIVYSNVREVSIDGSRFVSYGFKNFKNTNGIGSKYNVVGVFESSLSQTEMTLENWRLFDSPSFNDLSLGENGPESTLSLDFTAKKDSIVTNSFIKNSLEKFTITNNISSGDTTIYVQGHNFETGEYIDFQDGLNSSFYHQVISVSDDFVEIFPAAKRSFQKTSSLNSYASRTITGKTKDFSSETSIEILIRQIDSDYLSDKITFFIETINGYRIYYEIPVFDKWFYLNLFWYDETAPISVELKDSFGNNMPDNLKVNFFLKSSGGHIVNNFTHSIVADSIEGTKKIYLESVEGVEIGTNVTISNSKNQKNRVAEFSLNEDGLDLAPYIVLKNPLSFSVGPSFGGGSVNIELKEEKEEEVDLSNQITNIKLPFIDVSPIIMGKNLSESELEPFDNPVDKNDTFEELNVNSSYIKYGSGNFPLIDNKNIIRFLPITQDNVRTKLEKEDFIKDILILDFFKGFSNQINPTDEIEEESDEIIEVNKDQIKDYSLLTPVYSKNGLATSYLSTSSIEYEESIVLEPPVYVSSFGFIKELISKKYTVESNIENVGATGNVTSISKLGETTIDFAPTISIQSKINFNNDGLLYFHYEFDDSEICKAVRKVEARYENIGTYASATNSVVIDYFVFDRLVPLKDGTLNITIYRNKEKADSHEEIMDGRYPSHPEQSSAIYSMEYFNARLPDKIEIDPETGDQIQIPQNTKIDTWRESVRSNSNPTASDDFLPEEVDETVQDLEERTGGNVILQEKEVTGIDFAYASASEFTLADQLDSYEIQIPIVNGKAQLVIPPSDEICILLVEASYSYNNDLFESIRTDWFFVDNPLQIGPFSLLNLTANGSTEYDLFNIVYWMGEAIVEDQILLEIEDDNDRFSPAFGLTENSIAKGQKTKPKKPIAVKNYDDEIQTFCGIEELYSLSLSNSSGYERVIERPLVWTGAEYSTNWGGINVIGEADKGAIWGDGGDFTYIRFDLKKNYSLSYELPEDVINSILGKNLDPQQPAYVPLNSSVSEYVDGENFLDIGNNGVFTFKVKGVNRNVGNLSIIEEPAPNEKGTPFELTLASNCGVSLTNFIGNFDDGNLVVLDEDGETRGIPLGYVIPGYDPPNEEPPHSMAAKCEKIQILEPLGLQVHVETSTGRVFRDGESTANIVAEVTWKEDHLRKYITLNDESGEYQIPYDFPDVIFEIGNCEKGNSKKTSALSDRRAGRGKCYKVSPMNSNIVSLSSYKVRVGLLRTDYLLSTFDQSEGVFVFSNSKLHNNSSSTISSHCHSCFVDENGNGYTTGTISLKGDVPDHIHEIKDYVISSDETMTTHSHSLKSVAITTLNPISETLLEDVTLLSTVIYDPTDCTPYGNEEYVPFSNRKMFDSTEIIADSEEEEDLGPLALSLQGQYSFSDSFDGLDDEGGGFGFEFSNSIDEIEGGFEIKAEIGYRSGEESEDGTAPIIPIDEPLGEKLRIHYDVLVYKYDKSNSIQGVIGEDFKDKIYQIAIYAKTEVDGIVYSGLIKIDLNSTKTLFKNVINLTPEFENDDIYFENAIGLVNPIGESQVFDGINLSVNRMIDLISIDSKYNDYKKIIFLLSDGEENDSIKSYNQTLNNTLGISENPIQIIPIKLGNHSLIEEALLEKIATDTKSFSVGFNNKSTNNVLNEIFENETLSFKQTIIKRQTIFPQETIVKDIILPFTNMPENSIIEYRLKTYKDGVSEEWGEFKKYDGKIELDELVEKVDIEFKLYINENFEAPEIQDNFEVNYLDPQEIYIFFKPQIINLKNNEYISSIIINHEGYIPEYSEIKYGITQFKTSDPSYFYSETRQEVEAHKRSILNTRYNELLISENGIEYYAINGKWHESSEIKIYAENGVLIKDTEYDLDPSSGKVLFKLSRSPNYKFYIDVELSNRFTLYARIKNLDNDAAHIDHIGVTYNISERFQ